jgi:hypothetical protein
LSTVEIQETNAQYHADTSRISNSMLSVFKKSPKLFFSYYIKRDLAIPESTESMLLGSMVHCMILEPEEFAKRYAIRPQCDRRTTVGRKIFEEFSATLNSSVEIVKSEDAAIAAACYRSLIAHEDFQEAMKATWETRIVEKRIDFDVAGISMRCKPDYLSKEAAVIIDVKTTDDASPEEFAKSIVKYGYHRQAWLYREAAFQEHDIYCRFIFAVVCTNAPYEVALYEPSIEMMEAGRREALTLLDEYKARLESGDWTSEWSKGIVPIELPKWYRG